MSRRVCLLVVAEAARLETMNTLVALGLDPTKPNAAGLTPQQLLGTSSQPKSGVVWLELVQN
jgi:hypothetical protein